MFHWTVQGRGIRNGQEVTEISFNEYLGARYNTRLNKTKIPHEAYILLGKTDMIKVEYKGPIEHLM